MTFLVCITKKWSSDQLLPFQTIVTYNDVARLRLLSAGIRVFLRQDSSNKLDLKCKWRIPSEGLNSIGIHLDQTKIIDAGLEEIRIFLENSYPMVS
jgi:multisite-specific tRNA:(cytosine-C5)-methyltransferase